MIDLRVSQLHASINSDIYDGVSILGWSLGLMGVVFFVVTM